MRTQLLDAASTCINMFYDPTVSFKARDIGVEEIHFSYPLRKVTGNAVDADSLKSLQHQVGNILNVECGPFWVGVYGEYFHVWAMTRRKS